MNTVRMVRVLALAALLAPATAFAAGYSIYEQGAAALGMAGAYTASVNDASTLFYNPAAMTSLPGLTVTVGGSWLTTRNSFAGTQPTANAYPGFNVQESMKSGNFFPPHLYVAAPLGKRLAFGVGVNAPFGLGIEWENPATFTGREHATKGQLQTLAGSASLALALNERWSVSGGVTQMYANVELDKMNLATVPGGGGGRVNVASVHLESSLGSSSGSGMNAGLLWRPKKDWRVGLNYRAGIDVKVEDGDATFTQIPTGNPQFDAVVADSLPPSQKVATTLHFPSVFSVGAAWDAMPGWTWECDVNFTDWSVFDALPLDFKTTNSIDQSIIENYHDSYRVSVGAEHRLASHRYRFGYYYDQEAAPAQSVTVLLPDAARHGVTLGLGFDMGKEKSWTVDLYNLALFVDTRSTEGVSRDAYEGVFKAYVNAFGATVTHRW
ncbi:MAG: outer membrane protein transport protein [Candidatus Eisenbacteria bacterium]